MTPNRSAPAPDSGPLQVGPKGLGVAGALAGAVLVALPLASLAQQRGSEQKLEALERAVDSERERAGALDEKAARIAADAQETSRALVAIARQSRALESKIEALRSRIERLVQARREREARLKTERARLARLLAALQRIARNPPEAVLAYASSPTDMLRSAMLLESVVPHLEARARELRAELAKISRLGEDAARREAELAASAAELARKRKEGAHLLARKRALVRTTEAERKRTAARADQLADEARSLRELMDSLKEPGRPMAPPPPSPPGRQAKVVLVPLEGTLGRIPPITAARGRLTVPVVGRIVARFGVKGAVGTRNQGLRFASAPGAQVVAPHDGRVVFAGPFRGYGRLLIIDHGEGYHTLLAGLGRIDVAVNQRLLAGEPIGIMARTGRDHPRLYLELRRNGRPVDPLPWLAAAPIDKESG